jgi:hypothetical protein
MFYAKKYLSTNKKMFILIQIKCLIFRHDCGNIDISGISLLYFVFLPQMPEEVLKKAQKYAIYF